MQMLIVLRQQQQTFANFKRSKGEAVVQKRLPNELGPCICDKYVCHLMLPYNVNCIYIAVYTTYQVITAAFGAQNSTTLPSISRITGAFVACSSTQRNAVQILNYQTQQVFDVLTNLCLCL